MPDETHGARPRRLGRPRRQVHPQLYHVRFCMVAPFCATQSRPTPHSRRHGSASPSPRTPRRPCAHEKSFCRMHTHTHTRTRTPGHESRRSTSMHTPQRLVASASRLTYAARCALPGRCTRLARRGTTWSPRRPLPRPRSSTSSPTPPVRWHARHPHARQGLPRPYGGGGGGCPCACATRVRCPPGCCCRSRACVVVPVHGHNPLAGTTYSSAVFVPVKPDFIVCSDPPPPPHHTQTHAHHHHHRHLIPSTRTHCAAVTVLPCSPRNPRG